MVARNRKRTPSKMGFPILASLDGFWAFFFATNVVLEGSSSILGYVGIFLFGVFRATALGLM